eukprot:739316-Pelagomonas_calceolata.AAC.1
MQPIQHQLELIRLIAGKITRGKWAALLNPKMWAHTGLLAAIHQDVLIICIHAFDHSQQAHRHTNALK